MALLTQTLLMLLVVSSGCMLGVQIGISGPALVLESARENCSLYSAPLSCNGTSGCFWKVTGVTSPRRSGDDDNQSILAGGEGECLFSDLAASGELQCAARLNSSFCVKKSNSSSSSSMMTASPCFWRDGACYHNAGWSSIQIGWFTSLLCVGALAATPLIERATAMVGGRSQMLTLAGVAGTVVAAGSQIAFAVRTSSSTASLFFIFLFRAVAGCTTSICCVSTNLLLSERMDSDEQKRTAGAAFQGATTFGIALCGGVALALQATTDYGRDSGEKVKADLEIVISLNLICSLILAVVGLATARRLVKEDATNPRLTNLVEAAVATESSSLIEEEGGNSRDAANVSAETASSVTRPATDDDSCSWREILSIIFLPVGQQCSGINAFISLGVLVAGAAGVSPLIGNVIITSVNCFMSLVAVALASRLRFRTAFLAGLLCCAFSDSIVVIAFWPGVMNDSETRGIVVFVGALLFISAFELLLAPCYYALTTRTTASAVVRDKAIAASLFAEGVLSFFTNFSFPILVGAFSNSGLGQAVAFLFFIVASIVAFVVLAMFLRVSSDFS